MADLFVSYKAEDRARVRPLVEALQADGLDVWWDAHIGAGTDWRETIASNLEEARCVLVVWSRRSVAPEGRFVRDEATRALRREAYLPVAIDQVDPPLGFGETQCLPLIGWKGNRDDPRYLTLLDAVRHVGSGAPVRPAPVTAAAASGRGIDRRLVLGGGAVAAVAAAGGIGWAFLGGSPARANSVAVMPFANLSGDPAQAYFSDGLAEELRSALARVAGLKVIGRTSSEMLRDDDAIAAAQKLDVGNILTGSVRRSSNLIRVNAQLVDGATGVEQWSQSFDRPDGDALTIQTSIAQAVVQQLRSRLSASDRTAIEVGGTDDPAAQEFVLRAEAIDSGGEEAFHTAIALYDEAIALDPDYALAHANKALSGTLLIAYYNDDVARLVPRMDEWAAIARKAIALAPDLALGYYALGQNRKNITRFREGWNEYLKALDLPGCPPEAMLAIGGQAAIMGGREKGAELVRAAKRLDPLNPGIRYSEALLADLSGDADGAVTMLSAILATDPSLQNARRQLVDAALHAGQDELAMREVERLPADFSQKWIVPATVAVRSGDLARAQSVLDDFRDEWGDPARYQFAQIRAQMGEVDGAFEELAAAERFRDPGLQYVPTDPLLNPLRDDPRLAALVTRLDFPNF